MLHAKKQMNFEMFHRSEFSMSVDEIFQTMRDLVSEQFAMEPAEVTMD